MWSRDDALMVGYDPFGRVPQSVPVVDILCILVSSLTGVIGQLFQNMLHVHAQSAILRGRP